MNKIISKILLVTILSNILYSNRVFASEVKTERIEEKTNISRVESRRFYSDRYIDKVSVYSNEEKIIKSMIYNDDVYLKLQRNSLGPQYAVINEVGEKNIINEANGKNFNVFDSKIGVVAEVNDFFAAYNIEIGNSKVFYKYDINTSKVEEIKPDFEGYKVFKEKMRDNGYTDVYLKNKQLNEFNPIWIEFKAYKGGHLEGIYNRKTNEIITWKVNGYEKSYLIKITGESAYICYMNTNNDYDQDNDEYYIYKIEKSNKIKIADIDRGLLSQDLIVKNISDDGMLILLDREYTNSSNLYAKTKNSSSYIFKGSGAFISGNDGWVEKNIGFYSNAIAYYNRETDISEVIYNDIGENNLISNGKYNVFVYYSSPFPGEYKSSYFRFKDEEVDKVEKPEIFDVNLSHDTFYEDYPYKISVNATEGALIKFYVVKDGVGSESGYSEKNEYITTADNRNEIYIYAKNKDSKYNYDTVYHISEFIASSVGNPQYTLNSETGVIKGRSKEPVEIVHRSIGGYIIEKVASDIDELGNFELKLNYPIIKGEYIEIKYLSSYNGEKVYFGTSTNNGLVVMTNVDTEIIGYLYGARPYKSIVKVNDDEYNVPTTYGRFNIDLDSKLTEGTVIELIGYDYGNKEIFREKTTVVKDEAPVINLKQDIITINEWEVWGFNPLKVGVTANDKENGYIEPKIKKNNVGTTPGKYSVTYSAEDYKGQVTEKELTVIVNEAPKIYGASNLTVKVGDYIDLKEGVTAQDKEDGDLTELIKVNGNIDTTKIGTYEIWYSVRDSNNAETDAMRIITVDYAKEDVNKDGVIDIVDLSIVASNYNLTSEDINWNAIVDVNSDSIVDLFDLVLISKKIN